MTNFVFYVSPFHRCVAWLTKKRQNDDLRDNVNMDASHNSKLHVLNHTNYKSQSHRVFSTKSISQKF